MPTGRRANSVELIQPIQLELARLDLRERKHYLAIRISMDTDSVWWAQEQQQEANICTLKIYQPAPFAFLARKHPMFVLGPTTSELDATKLHCLLAGLCSAPASYSLISARPGRASR